MRFSCLMRLRFFYRERTTNREFGKKDKGLATQVGVLYLGPILKSCANTGALAEGKRLHCQIVKFGFAGNRFLSTALIVLYSKCGYLGDAEVIFGRLLDKDAISWTAMISGYAQHGQNKNALDLYWKMHLEGVDPSTVTFITILSLCSCLTAIAEGKKIHAHALNRGLESSLIVGNALINLYGKCGYLDNAQIVCFGMREHNVISWTAIIGAYMQHGYSKEGYNCFQQMKQEGVMPSKITFVTVLDSCCNYWDLAKGKLIHAGIVDQALESHVIVGTALLNMYGKCGHVGGACQVFDKISNLDLVSWNAIITAYAECGHGNKAFYMLRQMLVEYTCPDRVTFIALMGTCSGKESLASGKLIDAYMSMGGLKSDITLGNALINMYGKCGSPDHARQAFDEMHERNLWSWNAMAAVYAQHGEAKEAVEIFQEMQLQDIKPDNITFISVLDACAMLAALTKGIMIHACVLGTSLLADIFLATAIINMYGRCGKPEDAFIVFDMMPKRNMASFTAMITTLGQNGRNQEALQLLQRMLIEGIMPNQITFVAIMSACNHISLIKEGFYYFVSMARDYSVIPMSVHGGCMVDLLGRAGWVESAEDFITNLAFYSDEVLWKTLLGACRIHSYMACGKRAAKHVHGLNMHDTAAYILLANICATSAENVTVFETPGLRGSEAEQGLQIFVGY